MRARGQSFLTLMLAALLALGGAAFARLGPKEPAPAPEGSAESGAWLCPHGGGNGYEGTVFLANPGASDVSTRGRRAARGLVRRLVCSTTRCRPT